ncbi:MAG TPA: hypothetical protein VHC44_08040 [Verrucomicrobiae bacterium]|nr:hypothetical protein [Verrucomicrobiae bacterium]
MAYTINLDDDFVGAEELQLLKTKHAILEKLRVRFGEMANSEHRTGTKTSIAKGSPHNRADHPR